MITMETEFFPRGSYVSVYKLSLAKQMEVNKRLLEHDQKLQNQQKRIEHQKEETESFVCDWQQEYNNSK